MLLSLTSTKWPHNMHTHTVFCNSFTPPNPPLQASLEGSEALLSLPGAVMIGREPLDLGPWPDVGPLRATRAVLASAYSIVQEVKV